MSRWLLCITAAYLLGSIPFGVLIGRSRGVDIRKVGSGNVGATNVGRLLGRRFGLMCFLLDAAKGAVAVVAAGVITGVGGRPLTELAQPAAGMGTPQLWGWLAVAVAAVLGHMYSPWLGFKGGKGVATGFGAIVAIWPLLTIPAAVGLVVWAAVLTATRLMAIASMSAAVSLPITSILVAIGPTLLGRSDAPTTAHLRADLPVILTTTALAGFVVFKHRSNIARIKAGTEPRIGG